MMSAIAIGGYAEMEAGPQLGGGEFGAKGLTDLMLAEQAPNDGPRRYLPNPAFKQIGLAVTRDSTGKVWFTQDFVN